MFTKPSKLEIEPAQAQSTAKGRLLVDALVLCLQRSKVGDSFDPDTLRSILQASLSETWREGEFRLETLWKILCQQVELTPVEIAPPLLIFKEYEHELDVRVRLPHALSAIPSDAQIMLKEALPLSREEFVLELAKIRETVRLNLKEESAPAAPDVAALADAAANEDPAVTTPKTGRRSSRLRMVTALALSIVGLAALAVGLYVAFYNSAHPFDVSDTASILQLSDATCDGTSLVARIQDPRWDTLNREDQRKLARRVMELEAQKGIRALTLVDSTRLTRAIGYLAGDELQVSIP